jgi:hypothetical protein
MESQAGWYFCELIVVAEKQSKKRRIGSLFTASPGSESITGWGYEAGGLRFM